MTAEAWAWVLIGGVGLLVLTLGGLFADRYDAKHRDARRRNG